MDEHYRQHYKDTEKPLTHGLSANEFDVHADQQRLQQVQEIPCNIDPNYTIPLIEAETFYRVSQEVKYYNPRIGEKESKERVSKYHIRQFNHMLDKGLFKGEVRVIHDPIKYREALLKAKQAVGQMPPPEKAGQHQGRQTPEEILDQGPNEEIPQTPGPTNLPSAPESEQEVENVLKEAKEFMGMEGDQANDQNEGTDQGPESGPEHEQEDLNEGGDKQVPANDHQGDATGAPEPGPTDEEDIPVIDLDNVDEPTNLDNNDEANN